MGMSGHASGEAVVGVTIGMTVLAGIAVISRLATRVGIVRNAGIDDAFITLALLFSIATTITMVLQVNNGMGKHQDSLSLPEQFAQLKFLWASIWVYQLSISFTKFSILFQYLRIFPDRKLWPDRRGVRVQLLDLLQRRIRLHASAVFLEARYPGWTLSGSIRRLVCYWEVASCGKLWTNSLAYM